MRDWPDLVRRHLGPLSVDPARAADIVDELAQHVALHHAELVAAGVPDEEAAEKALAPIRERARLAAEIAGSDRPRASAPPPPSASPHILASLWADVRYSIRLLRRSPGFTTVAVLTLALGIGANTAVFGVVRSVLLRPLPYANADTLVTLGDAGDDGYPGPVGFQTILDWRTRLHRLQEIAIVRMWQPAVTIDGNLQLIDGMRVSANYFPMLGVHPAIGRDFRPQDDTQNDWRVVMLSDRLWRRAFNADPAIADHPIVLSGRQYRVAGVLPASFEPLISERYYKAADIWALLGYDETLPYACRSCQQLRAFGVLQPGSTVRAAQDELEVVQAQMRREHPADYSQSQRVAVTSLSDDLTQGVRGVLWLLMAAVGLVLLIACANVANLLLARAARRDRELVLRVALGASRARVIQQTLVESLVLSFSGSVVALAVAALTVPLLTALAPTPMARLSGAAIDGGVLLFSLGLAAATGVIFGLIPALRAIRVDLRGASVGPRGGTATTATSITRRSLIAGEVALAVVLLSGAGLMVRSIAALAGVEPGFDPSHVLTMQATFVGQTYAQNAAVISAQDAILDRLRAMPGVTAAAASGQVPLDGNYDAYGVHAEGRFRGRDGADDPSAERFSVTAAYAAALRIPVIRGRFVNAADTAASPMVIVVSQRTADDLWPGENPIGARVKVGSLDGPWRTVVGIVGDVRHRSLALTPPLQIYLPQSQFTDGAVTFVVRANDDPMMLGTQARQLVHEAAANVSVGRVTSLEDLLVRSIGPRRFVMTLLMIFGAVALALTAVGIYGVIACSVQERTREIGIRSALGASRLAVVRLVLGSGLAVVGIGVLAGIGASAAGLRLLEPSLYATPVRDPITISVSALILIAAAVAAHGVPVARALRVDPTIALREE